MPVAGQDMDEVIGAEATAHLQAVGARPHQDDPGDSELFTGLDRHQSHGARAEDGDVVAGDIPPP
jgi:hypothetical protein